MNPQNITKVKETKVEDITVKKYDYIDAIRGVAILGVVLLHCSQWIPPTSRFLYKMASEGARGVQLFFIASSLTLFLSMASRKRRKEQKSIVSFFIRRFFRIAPLFYLAIIVYTFYEGFAPRHWAPNGLEWWYILSATLFIHGWHPETISSVVPGSWTIAVEMTFYLFVPYLFVKLNNIRKTTLFLLVSLIVAKSSSVIALYFWLPKYSVEQQYIASKFTILWFFSQFPVFIAGILLYHLINKYPRQNKKTAFFLLVLSLFLFIAFSSAQTFANLLSKDFLYGLAFVIFSLSLYYSPNSLIVNQFTILVGKLSFSIYLTHFMVLNILENTVFPNGFILNGNPGFILVFIFVLALSILVSYITYNLVELPGIKLGKKVTRILK